MARGVLQSIQPICSQPRRYRCGATFCGVRCSFRDFRRSVAAVLVNRSRFAIGPRPGCAVFPCPSRVRLRLGKGPQPLVEFRAPLKFCPDQPSPTAAALRHLSWTSVPFGTCRNRRSTLMRAVPARALRPQGLITLATAYSRRNRAGLVSCRQRPWVSPFGAFSSRRAATAFPPLAEPTCRLIPRFTPPPKRQRRLARPRLLGSFPERIPCPAARVERSAEPVAPLGLRPSKVLQRRSKTRGLAAPHSRTLTAAASGRRMRLRVSRSAPGPDRRPCRNMGGRSDPHGVFAPVQSAAFERRDQPSYVFTDRRAVRCRP